MIYYFPLHFLLLFCHTIVLDIVHVFVCVSVPAVSHPLASRHTPCRPYKPHISPAYHRDHRNYNIARQAKCVTIQWSRQCQMYTDKQDVVNLQTFADIMFDTWRFVSKHIIGTLRKVVYSAPYFLPPPFWEVQESGRVWKLYRICNMINLPLFYLHI